MTYSNANRPTKNERREHAREVARQEREKEKKRRRRRLFIVQGSVGAAVIAIVAAVAIVISGGGGGAAVSAAGPLNMLSDGILLTGDTGAMAPVSTAALGADADPVATTPTDTAIANIVTYVDHLCPYCNQFETANAEQIASWVASGIATVEIHPISILDSSSAGSEYSTRAANAASCVANYDPDDFYAVNTALYANQPEEGTTGLTDDELISILAEAGADGDAISTCVTDEEFSTWVGEATDRALEGPLPNADVTAVTGTPTVLVNGQSYSGSLTDATEFESFVISAVSAE